MCKAEKVPFLHKFAVIFATSAHQTKMATAGRLWKTEREGLAEGRLPDFSDFSLSYFPSLQCVTRSDTVASCTSAQMLDHFDSQW